MRIGSVVGAPVLAGLLVASGLVSCDDGGEPEALLLEITSEPPTFDGRLDRVRVLFADGETRFPVDMTDGDSTTEDDFWRDPVEGPLVFRVDYSGATFSGSDDRVTLHVTGWIGDQVASRSERTVDLRAREVVAVNLVAVPPHCDADGDGFLDCALEGCCGAGRDALSDCEPDDPSAHPFWSGKERCDGIDNDCDGLTDEGFDGLGNQCSEPKDWPSCTKGVQVCTPSGRGVWCVAAAGSGPCDDD